MPSKTAENAKRIERVAMKGGADKVGFADTRKLLGIFVHPANLLEEFPCAISIVAGLDKWKKYDSSAEDEFAFPLLEKVAGDVKRTIEKMGYSAKVILPDKRVAHNSPLYWKGEVSHKAVAKTAGLGWIGRSTLLVTPELGPRVCLATIFTDTSLPPGSPLMNRCGSCRLCILSCPRKALHRSSFADHPERIEQAIDVKACGSSVNRIWKDKRMCYECMLVCPIGKRTKQGRNENRERVSRAAVEFCPTSRRSTNRGSPATRPARTA